MKKIRLKNDMNIKGWGLLPKGTALNVIRFNKRFVYCELKERVTLRLARKADCEIVY